MNTKRTRELDRKKVIRRKSNSLGFPTNEAIPAERAKSIEVGGYRISKRDDRKRFGKTTGKRYYGHFSGRCHHHLSRRDLIERAEISMATDNTFTAGACRGDARASPGEPEAPDSRSVQPARWDLVFHPRQL